MKSDIQILRHAELNDIPISGMNHSIDDFSAFRFAFEQQEEVAYSYMRSSFKSDFFSMIRLLQGSMTIRIDFRTITVPANQVFLLTASAVKQLLQISPDCSIEGISFTSDFISRIRIHENVLGLMEFFSSRYEPVWPLSKHEGKTISQLIRKLGARVVRQGQGIFSNELLSINFAELLYELAEIGKRNTNLAISYNRKEALVIRFTELARNSHRSQKKLSYYSQQLHVTSKYLSETAKEITGKTAGQLIDELDLMEARRLLEDTDMSISEIAYQLQFSNPAFFSRFFHRLGGCSPRSYRAALNR